MEFSTIVLVSVLLTATITATVAVLAWVVIHVGFPHGPRH